MFNLSNFISEYITERDSSLFVNDLANNEAELRAQIENKKVLVIGGAGTIGSSYIRALLEFKPAKLFVVDTNENGLTELTRDLRSGNAHVPADYKTYPMDFGSPLFTKLLRFEGKFDIVANFAAHKHVRSEKDRYSVEAMIENNVLKAQRLMEELLKNPPAHFFCVSTDKAANPVNIMGASKQLMEEVILAYADRLKITTARFANVAFSNGSLLDGFIQRMLKQQPLSAPSDVRRYFVSPEESGQICLLACVLGKNREIFFPRLGTHQMKSFDDIAVNFLQAYGGFAPDKCSSEEGAKQAAAVISSDTTKYPVYFSPSSTSGEKLFEEFFMPGETVDYDRFEELGIVRKEKSLEIGEVNVLVEKLSELFESSAEKASIVELLNSFTKNFNHLETGGSLDNKM